MPHTALFFSQQLTFTSHTDLPVNPDAVMDVYLFNSNTIDSEQLTALAEHHLHPREQAVFAKRKQLQAQQEYLASRFIIKTYASQYLGYSFESLYVLFDSKDTCLKVYHQDEAISLHCCISHSRGHVLIALLPTKKITTNQGIKLGVDLEWISTKRSLDKVAKHYYHSEELRACMAQAVNAKALYRIWTLKEALAKAIKQPMAKLLRDNVFDYCQPLNVQSGSYQHTDGECGEVFDISIISNIKLTNHTNIKILTGKLTQDLRKVK